MATKTKKTTGARVNRATVTISEKQRKQDVKITSCFQASLSIRGLINNSVKARSEVQNLVAGITGHEVRDIRTDAKRFPIASKCAEALTQVHACARELRGFFASYPSWQDGIIVRTDKARSFLERAQKLASTLEIAHDKFLSLFEQEREVIIAEMSDIISEEKFPSTKELRKRFEVIINLEPVQISKLDAFTGLPSDLQKQFQAAFEKSLKSRFESVRAQLISKLLGDEKGQVGGISHLRSRLEALVNNPAAKWHESAVAKCLEVAQDCAAMDILDDKDIQSLSQEVVSFCERFDSTLARSNESYALEAISTLRALERKAEAALR